MGPNVYFVRISLADVHAILCQVGYFDNHYDFHFFEENLEGFDLMNCGVLQICRKHQEEDVAVIFPHFEIPEPVEITYQG